jgi:hypothetical protein
MSRPSGKPERKAKKSFTLSLRSVAFLETMKARRRAASVSSVLEEILQAAQRRQERLSIGRAVSDYYSALSDEELTEQAEWGEFAQGEFSKSERA